MTTEEMREKIRGRMMEVIEAYNNGLVSHYPDLGTQLMMCLNSLGVVIKVEKPFRIAESVNDDGFVQAIPLIEEGKDG